MNRQSLLFSGVILSALVLLAVSALRFRTATEAHNSALRTHDAALRQAAEIQELTTGQQHAHQQKRPDQDVNAMILEVMATSGIASTHFKRLAEESDAQVRAQNNAATAYRKQSLRLELTNLPLTRIAGFLNELSNQHPLWIPSRLELSHHQTRGSEVSANYDLNVILTALYVAPSETTRP